MESSTIITILKQWNLWEKEIDVGIVREIYVQYIYPYMERKEILVLKGVRRAGKSTLTKQLMLELIRQKQAQKKQILYLNLEDYNFANDLHLGLFDEVLEAYKTYSGNKERIFFFIDEVQKMPRWEEWIRTKYDLEEDIKFIVTGSSASLLSKEFSTLLTGRNLSFEVHPLSFQEFLRFTSDAPLEDYFLYGGFPEVVLEPSPEKKMFILQQYFEDIVHKDIIGRYKVRNPKRLLQIARYLVSTSGSKVSTHKLSRVFGISKDTVAEYISYMVDCYLLGEVSFFSYSAKIRHDVTKLPKLYALDSGLVNAVTIKYSKNLGQQFENAVFIKLREQFKEIYYWSEMKSEVDFIVDNTAINVTATDNVHQREIQGLEDFQKKHKNFSVILVTKSTTKENMVALQDFLRNITSQPT